MMKSKPLERKYTKIYFRVFPTETMVWDYVKILDDHRTIYIRCLQELAKSKENVIPTFWTFQTDRVFLNENQQEIYNCVTTDVLSNLFQGRDAIIMAYGQTGTGKSLTISGVHNSYEDRGILPRIISDLFQMKKNMKSNKKICIQISFVEISKTITHDLLKSYPNSINSLQSVTKIKVKSEDDALKHLFRGEGRKEYFEDSLYPSHSFTSIYTFYITMKDKLQDHLKECKLHVIDFAGVDTSGNFSCLFKKPQEIGSANLAKTQLEQFFLVLSENIPQNIKTKYRLNLITQFLASSLNSSCILRLIGHIKISREDLLITISMLRFGQLIGGIKVAKYEINIQNKNINLNKVRNLQNQLNNKKFHEICDPNVRNQNFASAFDEDRFLHVQRVINEYLEDKITELTVLNVCDVNIALEILKMMYKKCEEEKGKMRNSSLLKAKADKSQINAKSSKTSYNKSSSSLQRKITEEKLKAKSRTYSAPLKTITQESDSHIVSKASSSSVMRRSLTGKKSSISSASKEKRRSKFDSMSAILEIPPEYHDAWDNYKTERKDEYENFLKLHQQNETEMKNAFSTYKSEIDHLRQITTTIEKIKNDLLMLQMTRQLQNISATGKSSSGLEECLVENLRKAEKEQMDKREFVLTTQAAFKVSLEVGQRLKNDLKNNFDYFCKEKYRMPTTDETPLNEIFMNIEDLFLEEENDVIELLPDNTEVEKFKEYKQLIYKEQKKKKTRQLKQREWTFY